MSFPFPFEGLKILFLETDPIRVDFVIIHIGDFSNWGREKTEEGKVDF